MPDHRDLLQVFVWQDYDLAPRFPRLIKFLDFWSHNLDGPLSTIRVAHAGISGPAEMRYRRQRMAFALSTHSLALRQQGEGGAKRRVRARAERGCRWIPRRLRRRSPHPPFGHLLPTGGEKEGTLEVSHISSSRRKPGPIPPLTDNTLPSPSNCEEKWNRCSVHKPSCQRKLPKTCHCRARPGNPLCHIIRLRSNGTMDPRTKSGDDSSLRFNPSAAIRARTVPWCYRSATLLSISEVPTRHVIAEHRQNPEPAHLRSRLAAGRLARRLHGHGRLS